MSHRAGGTTDTITRAQALRVRLNERSAAYRATSSTGDSSKSPSGPVAAGPLQRRAKSVVQTKKTSLSDKQIAQAATIRDRYELKHMTPEDLIEFQRFAASKLAKAGNSTSAGNSESRVAVSKRRPLGLTTGGSS